MYAFLDKNREYLSDEARRAAITRGFEAALLDDPSAITTARGFYQKFNLHFREARLARDYNLLPTAIPLDDIENVPNTAYEREVQRAEELLTQAARLEKQGKKNKARAAFLAARLVSEGTGRFDLANTAAYFLGDREQAMVFQELEEILDASSDRADPEVRAGRMSTSSTR